MNNGNGRIHITLFNVLVGVLVNAILLPALAVHTEEAAHRHARLVVLMEEAASLALHAKAAKPVTAHRLAKALPTRRVDIGVGLGSRSGWVVGLRDKRVGWDRGV